MDQPTELGDWRQISTLGSGAFGTVTLWCNQKNSDFIAIKKCKFHKASTLSPQQKKRWHMEVEFLKSIKHPNIIAFKKLDPDLAQMICKFNPTKLPLLSMEYCKKGNLRRYLTSEPIKLCGLPEHDVRGILEDILSGLSYLHSRKITHRDIKPDNIVLQHCDNRKGETVYKIIGRFFGTIENDMEDLGYAKELQDATLSFVGTLHYLAPEIFYNQDYNHSVDYWSVGTMSFEIICGVLPFLPELTPFERYEKIKNKGPDDICIYKSNSGAITNSTEIKREHFITSCFKQNIEAWLRRVLQMDPAHRSFGNDLSVFDYLRFILDKKIIQVFSVYKQEFYSYEINDSTVFSTLKNWISRDIKIPINDLHFIFRSSKDASGKIWHCNDDNTLLECLISTDDVMLYVYKKSMLFCEEYSQNMPKLVKELFNPSTKPQLKSGTKVYKQALFYVHTELRNVVEVKNAYFSLIRCIEIFCEKIQNKRKVATSEFEKVLAQANQFAQTRQTGELIVNNNAYPEVGECLKYFRWFISTLELREGNLKDFKKQCLKLLQTRPGIEEARKEIMKMFENCDIKKQFEIINGKPFLEKLKNGETHEVILNQITKVVSETIKLKYNLFLQNKTFKGYSKDLCLIFKGAEQLSSWVDGFIINVQKLSADFSVMEKKYDQILSEAVKMRQFALGLTFDIRDSDKIIKENELLRCRFADLLSEKVAAHKDFVAKSKAYFDLN